MPKQQPAQPTAPVTKRSLLDSLRERYGDRYSIQEVKEVIPLDIDSLKQHWKTFTDQLKQQQKHSQSNAFHMAELTIADEASFTVTIDSTLQQRFIEQEKLMILEYLQQQYNNRAVSFSFILMEGEREVIPSHLTMNSRERFERIAEQYPLVKELKDRLRLSLD